MAILKVPVTSEDHIQGSDKALITLVEYGDYECPFCRQGYYLIKDAQEYFGEQLRFVFRNFPLSEIHPLALPAAQAAEFAATKNHFWEMHDLIYENQENLSEELLFALATQLGLPMQEFETALINNSFESKIQQDFAGGVRSGVNGTPTFFINNHRYNGNLELQELISSIESVAVS